MSSKRIKWLDFSRGLAIFAVVIMHSIDNSPNYNPLLRVLFLALNNTLAIFAMPLFFVISGYLYKSTTTVHSFLVLCYKKIISFIIPYIAFTIISLSINLNSNYAIDNYMFLPIDYLWFLYALFFIFIIFGIMDLCHLSIYIELTISLVALIISCNVSSHLSIHDIVNPAKSILGFMFFFCLGIFIHKNNIIKKLNIYKFYLLTTLWIILVTIHFIVFRGYDTNFIYYNDIIIKLISIPVVLWACINFPHNTIFKYFNKYGKKSLVIYLFQSPVTYIIGIMIKHTFLYNNIHLLFNYYIPLIILLLITSISWLLCLFGCYLLKIKFIRFLFYPRKYVDKLLYKTKFGKIFLS